MSAPNLVDIISRARSVIEESDGADEHAELIAELTTAEAHVVRLLDLAQMVSMGNTDADDLATAAGHVLAGRREPICAVDMDEATYIGDDEDGVYVAVAKGEDGWYTSSVVDCNTSHFTDSLITDDGPYPTEEDARTAGLNGAKDWCINNNVNFEDTATNGK